jgi:hypothetical protein
MRATNQPTIRLLHTSLTVYRHRLLWLVQCSSDIGKPHDVGSVDVEAAAYQVIQRGPAGGSARPVATLDRGADPMLRTDALRATFRDAHATASALNSSLYVVAIIGSFSQSEHCIQPAPKSTNIAANLVLSMVRIC